MTDKDATSLSKKDLVRIINRLEEELERLRAEVAKSKKNSSTSSKPPSSDIVKGPAKQSAAKKKGKGQRKRGGQTGHPRHDRQEFAASEIDLFYEYRVERCDCGCRLQDGDGRGDQVIQQVEIQAAPIRIEEHRAKQGLCPRCGSTYNAILPREVRKAGLIGPRLTALVAYMKSVCHASLSTIRKFLRDVVGVTVSRGQLAKLVQKVSTSLDPLYEELINRLRFEPILNVDETGHKDSGDQHWTWCFRAESFTAFSIHPSRGSDVLVETLGKAFDGVLGCDYFSAYRKYMKDVNASVQFCLAHLIRDVRFLSTLPDKVTRNYANRVLSGLRELFRVIHRRGAMTEENFHVALCSARDALVDTAKRAPKRGEAQNLAKRFTDHGAAYFEFITTPGLEPTNNLAEQAIRFVVIDRKVTQGTRSLAGQRWCERIWTVLATCAQQGRSAFDVICESIESHLAGAPPPSLLPSSA
jgi:transposase